MPWSPLLTTRRVTKTIAIKCTRAAALAFVQNPEAMIDLNPLVISRSPHPEDPHHYTIRDRMSMFGKDMEFDYTVKFNMKDDGYDAQVKAPGPVTMKSSWSVREVEGGVEVTEDVEATVSYHLSPPRPLNLSLSRLLVSMSPLYVGRGCRVSRNSNTD